MRHDDYRVDKVCKSCGKPVLTPVLWSSKFYMPPKIPTCSHERFDQKPTTLRAVFKGRDKNVS